MSERPLAEEWERLARAWERWARTPGHDHHFLRFNWPGFASLLPAPGRATLDIGCGEGRVGRILSELGHRVAGVDASPSLVRLARETGAYDDVVLADAGALPFPDGAFDLAVAFMSLQDMDDPAAALAEAVRVLAPGGRLAAALVHPFASAHVGRDWAEQRPYFEIARTVDEIERDGIAFAFHQVHRPLEAWFRLLLDAGFSIEDVREPRPGEQDVRDEPNLANARLRPMFLHVLCRAGGPIYTQS